MKFMESMRYRYSTPGCRRRAQRIILVQLQNHHPTTGAYHYFAGFLCGRCPSPEPYKWVAIPVAGNLELADLVRRRDLARRRLFDFLDGFGDVFGPTEA